MVLPSEQQRWRERGHQRWEPGIDMPGFDMPDWDGDQKPSLGNRRSRSERGHGHYGGHGVGAAADSYDHGRHYNEDNFDPTNVQGDEHHYRAAAPMTIDIGDHGYDDDEVYDQDWAKGNFQAGTGKGKGIRAGSRKGAVPKAGPKGFGGYGKK